MQLPENRPRRFSLRLFVISYQGNGWKNQPVRSVPMTNNLITNNLSAGHSIPPLPFFPILRFIPVPPLTQGPHGRCGCKLPVFQSIGLITNN